MGLFHLYIIQIRYSILNVDIENMSNISRTVTSIRKKCTEHMQSWTQGQCQSGEKPNT